MRKIISLVLITAFICTSLYVPKLQAGEVVVPIMPKPGTMVNLSPSFTPAHLKGIVIHPDNALQFDFLIHKGDGVLDDVQKKEEYNKLIKYFLASLTVADKDQWVNLSPYEANRIIEDNFGKTEMGRDLLAQDYLLKQITSSLMYPESGLGKSFWDKVYEKAYKELGNTNIPVNTFNKVWIIPSEAVIHENGNTAFIVKSHLKVMLEEDYVSLGKHTATNTPQNKTHALSSKAIKDIILPALEKEVNEGKNFAQLRQVFSGMILASWYKQALKESLLGKVYADKAKVKGVDQDPKTNEAIYQQYLAAFKKGVYNYIKEDANKYSNQVIPRKYFAGGMHGMTPETLSRAMVSNKQMATDVRPYVLVLDSANASMVDTNEATATDAAMMRRREVLGAFASLPLAIFSGQSDAKIIVDDRMPPELKGILEQAVGFAQQVLTWPLIGSSDPDIVKMITTAKEYFKSPDVEVRFAIVNDLNEAINTGPKSSYQERMTSLGEARAMVMKLPPLKTDPKKRRYAIYFDLKTLAGGIAAITVGLAHELLGHLSYSEQELKGRSPVEEEVMAFRREIKYLEMLFSNPLLLTRINEVNPVSISDFRKLLEVEKSTLRFLEMQLAKEKGSKLNNNAMIGKDSDVRPAIERIVAQLVAEHFREAGQILDIGNSGAWLSSLASQGTQIISDVSPEFMENNSWQGIVSYAALDKSPSLKKRLAVVYRLLQENGVMLGFLDGNPEYEVLKDMLPNEYILPVKPPVEGSSMRAYPEYIRFNKIPFDQPHANVEHYGQDFREAHALISRQLAALRNGGNVAFDKKSVDDLKRAVNLVNAKYLPASASNYPVTIIDQHHLIQELIKAALIDAGFTGLDEVNILAWRSKTRILNVDRETVTGIPEGKNVVIFKDGNLVFDQLDTSVVPEGKVRLEATIAYVVAKKPIGGNVIAKEGPDAMPHNFPIGPKSKPPLTATAKVEAVVDEAMTSTVMKNLGVVQDPTSAYLNRIKGIPENNTSRRGFLSLLYFSVGASLLNGMPVLAQNSSSVIDPQSLNEFRSFIDQLKKSDGFRLSYDGQSVKKSFGYTSDKFSDLYERLISQVANESRQKGPFKSGEELKDALIRHGERIIVELNGGKQAVSTLSFRTAVEKINSRLKATQSTKEIEDIMLEFELLVRETLKRDKSKEQEIIKSLNELGGILLDKNYVMQQSPLGLDDEKFLVLYKVDSKEKHVSSSGTVDVYHVMQVTRFADGRLRGNDGWSPNFAKYVIVFDEAIKRKANVMAKAISSNTPIFNSDSNSPEGEMIRELSTLHLSLLQKAFPKEKRSEIDIANQMIEITTAHEVEHKLKEIREGHKPGTIVHNGVEEMVAISASVYRSTNPLIELTRMIEQSANIFDNPSSVFFIQFLMQFFEINVRGQALTILNNIKPNFEKYDERSLNQVNADIKQRARGMYKRMLGIDFDTVRVDRAQNSEGLKGGIDMNSSNMAMVIKRDGKGVPLPIAQQDLVQLSRIEGFVPRIIEIRPAINLPMFRQFQQK